ncbi:hypothetical protein ACPSKX_08095 [Moritella viscosa]
MKRILAPVEDVRSALHSLGIDADMMLAVAMHLQCPVFISTFTQR